ncbi:hypothetical protein C8Q77DRAFT_1065661, partial [Trametes polyzona]
SLNHSWLLPEDVVVVTPHKPDPDVPTNEKTDGGLYKVKDAPTKEQEHTKWAHIELVIECKVEETQDDPFEDDEKLTPEASGGERQKNLAQIMGYARNVFEHQKRTHAWTLLVLGSFARIARWDRAGIIVTKKFNYVKEPAKLGRFFWRFARMTAEQRGHDSTAELIEENSDEYKLMLQRANEPYTRDGCILGEHARKMFAKSLVESSRWWRLKVEDESGVRTFLVGAPSFVASGLAGRATQGYVAIDEADPYGPLTYLKDAWRVAHDRIQQEGKTLKDLNSEKDGGPVPYVPTLVCHGDVKGQVTASQEAWRRQHPEEAECPLKTHHHYRLVVKEVCLPMSDFENASQLVSMLTYCTKAHRAACVRKGYIHRDVSVGNTLIYPKPRLGDGGKWKETRVGLLTDWELAKSIHDTADGARQPDRTGTWQFMSASALADPRKRIIVQDDMESFFHILLYLAIRYLPHNCSNIGGFMDAYFDGYHKENGEYFGGVVKMNTMRNGELSSADAPITFYVIEKPADPLAQASGTLVATAQNPEAVEGGSPDGKPAPTPAAPALTGELHPINNVFTEFLKRLKAHYILHVPHREVSKFTASANGEDSQPPNVWSFTQEQSIEETDEYAEEELADLLESTPEPTEEPIPASHTPSATLEPPMSDERKAELEALAKELGDQDKIGKIIFSRAKGTRKWPKYRDRVPDQLDPKYRRNVEERAAAQVKRRADGPPESDSRPSKTSRSMR